MRNILYALMSFSIAAPVFASEKGVRIRFELTDKRPKKWDSTASVQPGKIERIDGWRFQQTDEVQGTTGWKTSTRPLTAEQRLRPGSQLLIASLKRRGVHGCQRSATATD